jgi:hypothetical protein
VRRESILRKSQRDDTLYSNLLFPVSRSTCFGRNPRPSSGARLNCNHSICVDSSDSSTTTAGHTPFVNPRCCEYSLNRAPDDGCMFHPKHVERLTGNNKMLYKVSSLWDFFKIYLRTFRDNLSVLSSSVKR